MSPHTLLEAGAAGVLAALVVASGVYTVRAEHQARRLFAELQELDREKDRLQVDWGRLQLEQSTWATHARIESVAREQLQLESPDDAQVVVVAAPVRPARDTGSARPPGDTDSGWPVAAEPAR